MAFEAKNSPNYCACSWRHVIFNNTKHLWEYYRSIRLRMCQCSTTAVFIEHFEAEKTPRGVGDFRYQANRICTHKISDEKKNYRNEKKICRHRPPPPYGKRVHGIFNAVQVRACLSMYIFWLVIAGFFWEVWNGAFNVYEGMRVCLWISFLLNWNQFCTECVIRLPSLDDL